jgi:hypothetical protein
LEEVGEQESPEEFPIYSDGEGNPLNARDDKEGDSSIAGDGAGATDSSSGDNGKEAAE